MQNRTRVVRGRVTLGVMLLVAVAGIFGPTVQARTAPKAALPAASELQIAEPVNAGDSVRPPASVAPPRQTELRRATRPMLSSEFPAEVEPNGSTATATPLPFNANRYVQMQGNIFPIGDFDYYSFTAQAGDRIYAAAVTSATASTSNDLQLRVFAPDGTTLIEFDDDDGSFGALSPSIANATLASAGTYFIEVKHFDNTNSIRPYFLHVRLQSGAPTPEVEGNDTPATANPLPANGWVSGTRNPAAATEQDWYSFTANAGDTVFLNLDVDPERDNVQWDGRLGIALFGDASNQILVVNDASAGSATNSLSEALMMTVKASGTYFAFVDSASAAVGGPTATYSLSVSVAPPPAPEPNCTTYTSTDVPKTIGPTPGLVSSVITVPGNPIISDVNVDIVLNHALMQDVDAHLRSPAGNDIGLFSDVGAAATGGQQQMDVVYDDEAAIVPAFTAFRGLQIKPESTYRLSWLDGENAGGTWTLDLRDDINNASGGTLTSWSLRICEAPPPPACPPGFGQQNVFLTDFESGAAGFTHSGTADEWELGLPATAATTLINAVAGFNTCASGVNCWKTDLDNTYNASSNQNLVSPPINLAGFSAPIVVSWSQRYQMETASNDHFNVDFQQVGGATPQRLFEWLDGTMIDSVGNPAVNIGASAGWGRVSARADSLAGLNSELVFHLDSNATNEFGGLAIDDVSVTGCRALSADLSITKTDGVTTATPGTSVTYTITASNAGPDPVTGATVADTFPAVLTCTWTCVGAGGGTCTAAGSGNISDTVNLPVGASTTYTATCPINASATGTLSNTATVSSSITDPNPASNSATDTDTLTPQASLAITKTDGVTTAIPGNSVTYTITASNAGPSNAPGASVADTFPAILACNWTCVGAGGGTCTAAGSGNIADTVNLPAGGSTTYTATCPINASATGTLSNTATVAAPAGVSDPVPGDNSATDTDTLTPQADLSITKTDGVTSVTAGGSTTYTITASNAGASNAPGATVTDTFPASLTCTWTCVGAGGGTCTAAGSGNISDTVNLPAGGSTTYTASCTISAAATGSLTNTANVTAPAGVSDPTPGNNSATDTDTILVPSAVTGTKTVSGTFTSGGTVTYTVTLNNSGGAQGNNPGNEFTDVLPGALALVSANASSGTATTAGNTVTWNGGIPSGGSVTITITATINVGATGNVSNQGTISYDSNGDGTNDASAVTDDPGTGTPNDPTVFGITPTANLSISKTDGATTVVAGGSTTYTIVVSNAGPNSVSGATVQDTFPASLTCTWTCAGTDGGTCAANGSGNINDAGVNLPFGATVTYTAVCAISASATGTLTNTASVAAPAGTNDPNTANNSASDSSTILVPAAVAGTKTVTGTFLPGGSVTYTVTLNNIGGNQGDNPGDEFTDVLPAALTLVSANASSGTATTAGNTVTWNGAIAAGGSVTITINATISASATGTISNQGNFSYDSDANGSNDASGVTDDPGTAVANDATSFALGSSADLTVTKTDGLTTVTAGTSSTYSIVVGNLGPSAIVGATVTDAFPAECTAPAWTCAATGGGNCPAAGSGAIAATVDLPVSATVTFTASCDVAVSVPAGTVISNTASAAVPAGASDPNPANNSATDTTTVSAAPQASVSGTKTVAGTFSIGGTVTYTIVLSNSGAGAQGDNPGNELTDTLPAQLTLVSATASSGTAVANIGTNTVNWNGAIAAGGSVTITITATINAGASGSISNQGLIAFDNDANGSNNAAVTTDDPAVGGPADATVFVVLGGPATPPVPVPGLTPFGMALLAAGVALAGLRRRRRS